MQFGVDSGGCWVLGLRLRGFEFKVVAFGVSRLWMRVLALERFRVWDFGLGVVRGLGALGLGHRLGV